MEKLMKHLDELIGRLEDACEFKKELDSLVSAFPFNEHEYVISNLLARNKLTLEEYLDLRNSYMNRNRYLHIFEISSPTGFGTTWAQKHIVELVPDFDHPNKQIDPDYSGEYDLYLRRNGTTVKIEIKASRAVDSGRPKDPLYTKALLSDSDKPFDMNFQQMKPRFCDVFIWIAVWKDRIRYWVLASKEIENNRYFSKGQHRGNVGEGQLHLNQKNIDKFKDYEVRSTEIKCAVIEAYKR